MSLVPSTPKRARRFFCVALLLHAWLCINSGGISLSLSASPKRSYVLSISNSGTFTLPQTQILTVVSFSGLQRRAESAGSVNNGEINLDNGSTYVIVEPVSGSGTINIISGNRYLHHPRTPLLLKLLYSRVKVCPRPFDPTQSNTHPYPCSWIHGKTNCHYGGCYFSLTRVPLVFNCHSGKLTVFFCHRYWILQFPCYSSSTPATSGLFLLPLLPHARYFPLAPLSRVQPFPLAVRIKVLRLVSRSVTTESNSVMSQSRPLRTAISYYEQH
nr:CIC_HP1_G0005950.mRNA.1.CDS.1 [Saccharomyces cerevisiae]